MLAARALGTRAGWTAVDRGVAAQVALLRLRPIALEGGLTRITAVGARRIELLILVVVPFCHGSSPITPRLAQSPTVTANNDARCVPLAVCRGTHSCSGPNHALECSRAA